MAAATEVVAALKVREVVLAAAVAADRAVLAVGAVSGAVDVVAGVAAFPEEAALALALMSSFSRGVPEDSRQKELGLMKISKFKCRRRWRDFASATSAASPFPPR